MNMTWGNRRRRRVQGHLFSGTRKHLDRKKGRRSAAHNKVKDRNNFREAARPPFTAGNTRCAIPVSAFPKIVEKSLTSSRHFVDRSSETETAALVIKVSDRSSCHAHDGVGEWNKIVAVVAGIACGIGGRLMPSDS